MERVPISTVRNDLDGLIARVAADRDPAIVSSEGRDVAAIISIEDLQLFERLREEEEDRQDIALAEAALAEGGENIPWEQFKAELGLK